MSSLLDSYDRYSASGEINTEVADQGAATESIRLHYANDSDVSVDDLDGLTFSAPTWWFNVRPSNTEPLLRLNVEADDEEIMIGVRDTVLAIMRGDKR